MKHLLFLLLAVFMLSCVNPTQKKQQFETTGSIERLSPVLNKIIPDSAKIEILADGFLWSEGPLWLGNEQKLLFTDVPSNLVYEYSDKNGLQVYLDPSGLTDDDPNTGNSGANGLVLDEDGSLILCQHGDRRVAKMMAPTANQESKFKTLAATYEGKRFNSPNDAVYDMHGNLYFTDPPYGLEGQDEDPAKELPFNGVYKLSPNGTVTLLIDDLTRPNGIAVSPDNTKLYVANSDPEKCLWMVYDLADDGTVSNGKVFFDATSMFDGKNGLSDGMKVNRQGIIFATGPGGVLVFSPEGEHLGTIKTGKATANCAFNDDETVLYMTAHNNLMRIKLTSNE
jgi:gluconolactonase